MGALVAALWVGWAITITDVSWGSGFAFFKYIIIYITAIILYLVLDLHFLVFLKGESYTGRLGLDIDIGPTADRRSCQTRLGDRLYPFLSLAVQINGWFDL